MKKKDSRKALKLETYRQVQDRWSGTCRPAVFRDKSKYHRPAERDKIRRAMRDDM